MFAARERPTIGVFNHRAGFEIGAGRASLFPRLPGSFDQVV